MVIDVFGNKQVERVLLFQKVNVFAIRKIQLLANFRQKRIFAGQTTGKGLGFGRSSRPGLYRYITARRLA